ncbi:caspase family protein [uncultured Tateyamaria sp.]|uniref:caspase family protein n=1 Tax=uncultured Tateyamaria sp. TaxID=455651 RepID=UPI00262D10F4|nr:caspase family protein [uncultured Tateyamaria sp.]
MIYRTLHVLVVACLLLGTAPAAWAERVALLIGNSGYSVPDMELRNPVNDVSALGEALRDLSFEVIEVADTDAAGMKQALQDFQVAATGAEMAVFFYAGHGVQIGGENYLVGTDFAGGELGAMRRTSLSMSDVRQTMTIAAPAIGIVILDACRNNPFSTNGLVRPGLVRDSGGAGLLIAYATDPGNVAYDGLGENSVYTSALLKHLDTPALDARLMLGRVRQEVVLETGGRQIPWVEEAVLGEHSFNPATSSPVIADAQVDELSRWRQISASLDVEAFERYLADYPNGLFERFAQDRIVALKSSARLAQADTPEVLIASADTNKLTAALSILGLETGENLSRGLRIYQQRLPDPSAMSAEQVYADAARMSIFLAATTLQQLRTDLVALRGIRRTLKISQDALAQMEEIAKTNADALPLVDQARRDINDILRAQGVVLRRLDETRTYYDDILDASSAFFPDDATLSLLGSADRSRDLGATGQRLNENASIFLRHLAQTDEDTKGSYKWLADLISQG